MLRRYPDGPLLTRTDIPDIPPAFSDVSSVFNPGVLQVGERVLLMLRVQSRGRETGLVRAWSPDGISFEVDSRLVEVRGFDKVGSKVHHLYDPRLTEVDGELLVVLAADTDQGCRLVVARCDASFDLDVVAVLPDKDMRNGVLFPERIGGHWVMLLRPNRLSLVDGPSSGDEIHLATSDDLQTWEPAGKVMSGRPHSWDERIGAGPPPIKTYAGWLMIYHGIATHFGGCNIYQAGACLLDLNDPTRVLARTRRNILEPRETWEVTGQVPNVIFPSGWIVAGHDSQGFIENDAVVNVYYGAADTCIGLATTTVAELLNACHDEETS